MVMEMILVSNYRKNQRLFSLLDVLGQQTFGIDLMKWRDDGLIGTNYIPYSYVSNGKIAANVSANLFACEIAGRTYQAVQFGTVMTDPSFRGHGLAGRLMNYVLSLYEKESLFVFLFANQNVHGFYPRFGFTHALQKKYVFRAADLGGSADSFHPVSWQNEEERALMISIAGNRVPLSDSFGLSGDPWPRITYLTYGDTAGKLFLSETLGAVAYMQTDGRRLFINDIFCRAEAQGNNRRAYMDRLLAALPLHDVDQVECGFSLDTSFENISGDFFDSPDDALFIRSSAPVILPDGKRLSPYSPANENRPEINLTGLRFSNLDHT